MENKSSKGKTIFLVIVIIALLIVVGILGYIAINKHFGNKPTEDTKGKINKGVDVTENSVTTKTETSSGSTLNVEANNQAITINLNTLDIEGLLGMINSDYTISKYYVIDDIVVFEVMAFNNKFIMISDTDGNIINRVAGATNYKFYNRTMGNTIKNIEVEGKVITIESDNLGQGTDTVCQAHGKDVVFKEKLEYLGSEMFSTLTPVGSTTKEKYISDNKIDCSNYNNYIEMGDKEETITYNSITVKATSKTAININGTDVYYSTDHEVSKIEIINDYVLVEFNNHGTLSYTFYNKSGNEVKNVNATTGKYEKYMVAGNAVYFVSYNVGQGINTICETTADVAVQVDMVEVSSTGISDVRTAETISRDMYISDNNIDCLSNY